MIQQMTPEPEQSRTQIPTRDACSSQQVETVLRILAHLQPYVMLTHREIEDDSGPKLELDGGTVVAAQVTFMKACERLDAILDDPKRWAMTEHDALYDAVTANHISAVELHKEQMISLKGLKRPSSHFKPQFTTVQGGLIIAYWGDLTDPGSLIIGKGNTPEEALLDYDAAFNRLAKDQVRFSPEAEAKLRARAEGQTPPTQQPEQKPGPRKRNRRAS